MSTITFSINGIAVTAAAGASVLEAARQNGFKIPTLCQHDDLTHQGACRVCLVEDEQSGRLMAACVTPAVAGISVLTHSPAVLRHRRNIVRLLMAEHPESCLVCDKGNRCRLRGIAAELGIGDAGLYPMPNYKTLEQANPFIARDLSKCILCGKCIRADQELVVVGALDYNLRGFKSRPCTLHDKALDASECTFCGTCLSMCPTGALSPAASGFAGTPESVSLTVCGFCPLGCALSLGVSGEQVVEVHPAALPDTVNRSTLCVRGHFAHDYLNSPERLTEPLMRSGQGLAPASWEQALGQVAARLKALRQEHGPGSLAFWGSTQCTNEENYLFQKIARSLLGSSNIDNIGAWGGRRAWQRIDETTGGGWRTMPLARLEQAEAILAVGADPCQTLPVMGYHIKRAAAKGALLVNAGVLPTDLERFAALAVRLAPDRHLTFIQALCAELVRIGGARPEFIESCSAGFERFRRQVSALYPGISGDRSAFEQSIAEAAEALKGRRIAAIAGRELILQPNGLACVDAMLDLLLLTGNLGTSGPGFYVESRENNLTGAWDMGSAPDLLPGRTPLGDDTSRRQWEKAWNCRISPDHGLSMGQILAAAEQGRIKGLFILGENPLRALPAAQRIRAALERIDFLVVQEIVCSETAALAHVVLPGTPFSEKAGTFTNLEGRVQSFQAAVRPLGRSRPDLEILAELAARLSDTGHRPSLAEIRSEIRRLVPMYAHWDGSARAAWLLPATGKRAFHPQRLGEPIAFSEPPGPQAGSPQEAYPFTALVVPARLHAGSATRSGLSPRVRRMAADGAIRFCGPDCRGLDLQPGSRVRITSVHGSLEREIAPDPRLSPRTLVVPLGFNANEALQLLPLAAVEGASAIAEPGYACRVKVEKVL